MGLSSIKAKKKYFSENLMATEMKKATEKLTKSIYLGLSILDIGIITPSQSTETKQNRY